MTLESINMDNENERMSDDSFYDSDMDEAMAEAANRSIYESYEPNTPFTPVVCTNNGDKFSTILSTTLSGRLLGSTSCSQASQSVLEQCTEALAAPEALEGIAKDTACESSDDVINSPRQPEMANLTTTQSSCTFIRASYFYHDAKEKLNQNAEELHKEERVTDMDIENTAPNNS